MQEFEHILISPMEFHFLFQLAICVPKHKIYISLNFQYLLVGKVTRKYLLTSL